MAALAVSEEYDGSGAGFMECQMVQEELGRALPPSPMLGSAVLAVQALLISGNADALRSTAARNCGRGSHRGHVLGWAARLGDTGGSGR